MISPDMTGYENESVREMILMLIQKRPIPNQDLCQIVMERSGTSRNTYYRHKKVLEEEGKIEMVRRDGKVWVCLAGRTPPAVEETPSRSDDVLIGECERLVSDIMASGLANPVDVNPAVPSPEALNLLRRCVSLHDSLQWLEARRKLELPKRWGSQKDWFKGSVEVWSPEKAMSGGPMLQGWMMYLLEVIDIMDRMTTKRIVGGRK